MGSSPMGLRSFGGGRTPAGGPSRTRQPVDHGELMIGLPETQSASVVQFPTGTGGLAQVIIGAAIERTIRARIARIAERLA